MTQQDRQLANYRSRARGPLAVWEEMRKEQNRLWTSTCLTPGGSRAKTLALLTKMVNRNDQTPGRGQPQPIGRTLTVPRTNNSPCSLDPIRKQSRNSGSHTQVVDPHLDIPFLGLSVWAGATLLHHPL